MEDLETSSLVEFHGIEYVVTIAVQRQHQLLIQVEMDDKRAAASVSVSASASATALPTTTTTTAAATTTTTTSSVSGSVAGSIKSMANCWTGEFPAAYIEEITRKTGNFKKFPVFVNMLLSAVSRRSDAVFVDLLTAADLELYRKRKMGKQQTSFRRPEEVSTPLSSTTTGNANKRYLILTYAVEFDRVHYPLPLKLVETPDVEILNRTIRRLRQELAELRAQMAEGGLDSAEIAELREENRCLKNTLKQYCGSDDVEGLLRGNQQDEFEFESPIDLKKELQASLNENKELIEIYEQLRSQSSAEISRLTQEIKQLRSNTNLSHTTQTIEYEKHQALQRNLEQEKADSQRKLSDMSTSLQQALSELQQTRAQMEQMQLKNRELMRQLAIARAKLPNDTTATKTARGSAGSVLRSAPRVSLVARANSYGAMRSNHNRENNGRTKYNSADDTEGEDDHDRIRRRPGRFPRRSPASAPASAISPRLNGSQRPFRRFDPTAYQLEKERKLRERSQSPGARTTRVRRGISSTAEAGYASDSSNGSGYSSATSNGSKKSTRSSRSARNAAYERQRALDARLASPKRSPNVNNQVPSPSPRALSKPPRGRSPGPPSSTSSKPNLPVPRFKSPIAAARESPKKALSTPINSSRSREPPQPLAKPTPTPIHTSNTGNTAASRKPRVASSSTSRSLLLADTSLDSFSDIDERLNALQKFLRDAKNKSPH